MPPWSQGTVWSRSQGAAGADQVLEFAAGPVARLGVGVVAGTAGDRDQADAQAAQVILRSGAGRRVGAESGTTGDSEVRAPGGGWRPDAQPCAAAVPSGFRAVMHQRVRGCLAAAATRARASVASIRPNEPT